MEYKIETKNNKRYITIPELTELGLKHCFTTIDMDMGTKTNGCIEDLTNNFQLIYDYLDIEPKMLYNGYQTHSANIASVSNINEGEITPFGRFFPDTDGLVTNKEGIALITRFADCTPILLFDPVKRVQANIHSGWKGTLQRIGANGIDVMIDKYNCDPKDIIAIIGPTIGKDDFEVDKDVMEMFEDQFAFYNEIIRKKDDVKYLIDLATTNKRILSAYGIKEENITIVDISTMSDSRFHSYRRDKAEFGLMGLVSIL